MADEVIARGTLLLAAELEQAKLEASLKLIQDKIAKAAKPLIIPAQLEQAKLQASLKKVQDQIAKTSDPLVIPTELEQAGLEAALKVVEGKISKATAPLLIPAELDNAKLQLSLLEAQKTLTSTADKGALIIQAQLDESKLQKALTQVAREADQSSAAFRSTFRTAFIDIAAGADEMAARLSKGLATIVGQADSDGQQISTAFIKGFQGASNALTGLQGAVEKGLGKSISAVGSTVKGLSAVAGAGLAAISVKAIKLGVDFNALQAQVKGALGVILGGGDAGTAAADKLLKSVNELADTISFIPRDVFLSATQNLVGFGVAADAVVPIMNSVQNAVAGIGGSQSDFQSIVDVFAKIQAAGRITGDTLLSFSLKGIDAAKLLADQLNKAGVGLDGVATKAQITGAEIKDAISKGSIDATKAIDLLVKGLNTKFGGAAGNLTKSLEVARNSIKSRLRDIGADITAAFVNPQGTIFDPKNVKAFKALTDASGNLKIDPKVAESFKTLQEGGGAFVVILDKVVQGLRAIRELVAQNTGLQTFLITAAVQANKLADAVLRFIFNLKSNQIGAFLKTLQTFAPVLTLLATKFFNAFASNIPFVGKLLSSFNPFIAALVVLAVKSESFRKSAGELFKVLGALATKVGPPLAEAFQKIQDAVGDLAGGALGAFTNTLKGLGPVIVLVANAVNIFAGALRPLVTLLSNPIFATVLEFFIAKAAIAKVTGTDAFKSIASAATTAIGAFKGFTPAAAEAGAETKNLAEHATTAKTAFTEATGGLVTLDQAVKGGTKGFASLKDAIKGASTTGKDLGTTLKSANTALSATGTKLVQNRDASGKFAKGFSEVATSGTKVASGLEAAAAGAGKLATAGAAAKGGLSALAGSIDPVTLSIQIATIGIGVMINRIEKLKAKANEKAADLKESLGLNDLTIAQLNGPDGAISGVTDLQKKLDAAKKKLNSGAQVKIGSFRIAPFKDVNKDAAAVDALEKQLKAVTDQSKNVKDVFGKLRGIKLPDEKGALGSLRGITDPEIIARAEKLGIKLKDLAPGPETNRAIKEITASFAELSTTIAGKVVPSLTSIQEGFDALETKSKDVISASGGLSSAQATLASANDQLSSATDSLNKLQKERQDVLKNTISPVKEMKKAEDDLAKTRRELASIDREQKKTEEDLAKLRGPKLATDREAADRAIERAKIALAKAQRDEKASQDDLNASTKEGTDLKDKDQKVEIKGVNLAGLTLDQARAKLANVRASLEAQKQAADGTKTAVDETGKATDKTGKTAVELAEDAKIKQLDTADAAQAVNDAIAARGQLETDNATAIQEDEQKLQDLQIQRSEILTEQETINQHIANIRKGDTEQGRALKAVDDQITAAKKQQAEAAKAVAAATDQVKIAQLELNKASALFRGDQLAALQAERDLFALKTKGLQLDQGTAAALKAQFDAVSGQLGQFERAQGIANDILAKSQKARDFQNAGLAAAQDGDISSSTLLLAQSIQQLSEAIGTEGALKQAALLAKVTGKAVPTVFAEGGLITKPTYSHMGEQYKHEIVLPLTKPNRVARLLGENIGKYPAALRAMQSAIAPHVAKSKASQQAGPAHELGAQVVQSFLAPQIDIAVPSASVVSTASILPTRAQVEEIIALLRAKFGSVINHYVRNVTNQLTGQTGTPGLPTAEGRMVTKPMTLWAGEGSNPELVLPLTKPNRVWKLIAENLPRYPGAMKAVQSAVGQIGDTTTTNTTNRTSAVKTISAVNNIVSKGAPSITREQAEEIIALLRRQFGSVVGKVEKYARVIYQKAQAPLRTPGLPTAEGRLVTRPMHLWAGEGSHHEMVLPLTKPDRVWELVSQNLPRYPGALQAVQAAVAPEEKARTIPSTSTLKSSFTSTVDKALTAGRGNTTSLITSALTPAPPAVVYTPTPEAARLKFNSRSGVPNGTSRMEERRTQREFAKMIAEELVGAGFQGNVTVEAPVHVDNPRLNEELVAKRIEERILRTIERRLR